MDIVCIGAGVMASAFALSQRCHQVSVIASEYDAKIVSEIQGSGRDNRLDVDWNSNIQFHAANSTLDGIKADLIVIGVSSQGIDWAISIAQKIIGEVGNTLPVVLLTKGLVLKGTQVTLLADEVSKQLVTDVFSVTGPCIAKELAHQKPTEVELSGSNKLLLPEIAAMISQPNYIVRMNSDYIGCQWASALKNVYAIAIAQAGDDHNLRSTRFSDAVIEMSQWSKAMGGLESTVFGLSGVGDLYVTCLGGRNGRLGRYLSQGLTVSDIMSGPMNGVTVEGLDLARELCHLPMAKHAKMYQSLLEVLV